MAKRSENRQSQADEAQPAPEAAPEAAPESPRARQSAAPECPYHPGTVTKSRNSSPFFTRYYCPIKGCPFSVKVPRPNMRTRLHAEDEDYSAR